MKISLKEWPLIIFTVLVQTVVGFFVFLFVLVVINRHYFFGSASIGPFSRLFRPALSLLLLMGLSLIVSLFHLGHPSAAYLAITNLKSSWLSREILGSSLFFGGLVLLTVFIFLGCSPVLILIIAFLEVLVGLAMPFIMSKIYRLPAVPAWNNCRTTLSFYLTTFLAGAGCLPLAGRYFFSAWPGSTLARQTIIILQVSLFFSTGCLLLFDQVVGLFSLKSEIQPEKFQSLKKISKIRPGLLILAFLSSFFLSWPASSSWLSGFFWPALILALVIIEEIIGRAVFFNLYERLGV